MIFKSSSQTVFVEQNEQSWIFARTSAATPPLTIEEIAEVSLRDEEGLAKTILAFKQAARLSSNFLTAVCSVYPQRRLIRRVSLDAKKVRETGYLNEVCTQQLRIEPDKYSLALLAASDGRPIDPSRITEKELLICGMPVDDINNIQDGLLKVGIYPHALEIGPLSTAGAFLDNVRFLKSRSPVLLLEIGNEATQSYIVTPSSVEAIRSIPFGIESMIPVVQKRLSLKDEESARKLFYSNTFDFTSMGADLVQRLLKELQSSIGFFEVQTGQSISHLACLLPSDKLAWVEACIANSLGIGAIKMDLKAWLASHGISLADGFESSSLTLRHLGILSLMVTYQNDPANVPANSKKD
jgi:Tfp pilus assembly PilM family ATPase